MADVGFRDVGSFGTKVRRAEPTVAPPPPPPPAARSPESAVLVTPPPTKRLPLYGGDRVAGEDALGFDPTLSRVAELLAHARTATPLTVGFLGAPGSGKTFALNRTLTLVRNLSSAAAKLSDTPFLSRVHLQPVDAAALGEDIVSGLAGIVHAGLRETYPDLAHSIGHTARDPHDVLRDVTEKLDDARRRLDLERRALEDASSRRARLTETVLFESGGSQVDAYARANRASIEGRLAAFGIGGDPIRSYKELVQYVAGSGGTLGLAIRSLWAFRGQVKLIVLAVLLVLAGIGLGIAIDDQASWLGALRSGPQAGATVADWSAKHIGLLSTARGGAFALAALAVLANLWRAFAFVTPILKGARLLGSDLETRRQDLDGLFGHQTKRVDTLERDVERLTRDVGVAETRAGGTDAVGRSQPSPFAMPGAVQVQHFFADLAGAMADKATRAAPQRVVLALDHLDAVLPERARAILDSLHRISGHGIVSLITVDASRLDPKGLRRAELMRWIELPVRLDADGDRRDAGNLVARALGGGSPAPAPKPDPKTSVLDTPLDDTEAAILTALTPLAGASPRAVRRFVAHYSMARLDGDARRGPLALMLALAQGDKPAERAAMADALAAADPSSTSDFSLPASSSPRLRAAAAAVTERDGPFSVGDAVTAAHAAARYTFAD